MRGGIAGMGTDSHFQRHLGFFILALACIQHSKVVIGFRQLGVVFGQCGKYAYRLIGLPLLGEDQTLQKTRLRILGFAEQKGVDLTQRLRVLTTFEQFVCVLNIVGSRTQAKT